MGDRRDPAAQSNRRPVHARIGPGNAGTNLGGGSGKQALTGPGCHRAWYNRPSNSIRIGRTSLSPILHGFFPIDNLMRRALSREAIPHLEQS